MPMGQGGSSLFFLWHRCLKSNYMPVKGQVDQFGSGMWVLLKILPEVNFCVLGMAGVGGKVKQKTPTIIYDSPINLWTFPQYFIRNLQKKVLLFPAR